METFLNIVFFISCIVLIATVLLQPGKTDAGALFTSGISSASLNPRGTASILSKLTIAAATCFMLSALLLSLPALTGKVSVLQTQGENKPTNAANTNSNVNADANANTANTNANSNVESNSTNSSNAESNSEQGKSDDRKSDEPKKGDEKQEAKTEVKTDEVKDKAEDKKEESK